MESLLAKVVGQSQDGPTGQTAEDTSRPSALQNNTPPSQSSSALLSTHTDGSSAEQGGQRIRVKQEFKEDLQILDQLGQLALDDHGHLRWIGSSSTMSLIQSFRTLTSEPVDRYSPSDDLFGADSTGNLLYFPAGLGFGKVQALPGPQDVEYPDRDLADKLVCIVWYVVSSLNVFPSLGGRILRPSPFSSAR
jgi:hypothetical protein